MIIFAYYDKVQFRCIGVRMNYVPHHLKFLVGMHNTTDDIPITTSLSSTTDHAWMKYQDQLIHRFVPPFPLGANRLKQTWVS